MKLRVKCRSSRNMRLWLAASSLLFLFLLAAPVAARMPARREAAKARRQAAKNGLQRLLVRGTHGYRIEVTGFGNRSKSRVTLTASRKGSFASYSVSGTAWNGSLRARFPGLGRIAVHFVTSGGLSRDGLSLSRQRSKPNHGVFVGTIRFVGEKGFTEVNASQASGSIIPTAEKSGYTTPVGSSLSRLRKGGNRASILGIYEELSVRKDQTYFEANIAASSGISWFRARANESRDGMEIERSTPDLTAATPDSFEYSGHTWAKVNPPPPFLGTGTYRAFAEPPFGEKGIPRDGGNGEFVGSLRVELPGLGDIRFGELSTASLTRDLHGE
jgi:hypothetical protein